MSKKVSKKSSAAKPTLKMGKTRLKLTEEDVQGISAGAPSSTKPSQTTCCHCDLCESKATVRS